MKTKNVWIFFIIPVIGVWLDHTQESICALLAVLIYQLNEILWLLGEKK